MLPIEKWEQENRGSWDKEIPCKRYHGNSEVGGRKRVYDKHNVRKREERSKTTKNSRKYKKLHNESQFKYRKTCPN